MSANESGGGGCGGGGCSQRSEAKLMKNRQPESWMIFPGLSADLTVAYFRYSPPFLPSTDSITLRIIRFRRLFVVVDVVAVVVHRL